MLLNNNYITDVTHDDRHLRSSYFYLAGHCCVINLHLNLVIAILLNAVAPYGNLMQRTVKSQKTFLRKCQILNPQGHRNVALGCFTNCLK